MVSQSAFFAEEITFACSDKRFYKSRKNFGLEKLSNVLFINQQRCGSSLKLYLIWKNPNGRDMSDWFADNFCCFLSYTTFQLGLKINNSNLFSALACYIYHLFIFWLLLSFPVQVAPHPAIERRQQQSKSENRQFGTRNDVIKERIVVLNPLSIHW